LKPTPQDHLIELAHYKMPFGKYKGYYLVDIPEAYFIWFQQKGFPEGKLGRLLEEVQELKVNGLESLLYQIRKTYPKPSNLKG
jgi:uncharacterized protein (DUF3820 family)